MKKFEFENIIHNKIQELEKDSINKFKDLEQILIFVKDKLKKREDIYTVLFMLLQAYSGLLHSIADCLQDGIIEQYELDIIIAKWNHLTQIGNLFINILKKILDQKEEL